MQQFIQGELSAYTYSTSPGLTYRYVYDLDEV